MTDINKLGEEVAELIKGAEKDKAKIAPMLRTVWAELEAKKEVNGMKSKGAWAARSSGSRCATASTSSRTAAARIRGKMRTQFAPSLGSSRAAQRRKKNWPKSGGRERPLKATRTSWFLKTRLTAPSPRCSTNFWRSLHPRATKSCRVKAWASSCQGSTRTSTRFWTWIAPRTERRSAAQPQRRRTPRGQRTKPRKSFSNAVNAASQ